DPEEMSGTGKAALPKLLPPELAILVDSAPAGESWLHEMKYDGYRILAHIEHGSVRLLSRNGRDWTDNFPTIAKALQGLDAERAFLDGEVAVLLEDGTTSFQALQNHLSGLHAGQLTYLVFDLPHRNGLDRTGARLEARKRLLADLLGPVRDAAGPLRYSDHVVGDGPAFFAQACRHGLEGIVSKLRDAPYRSTRSREWLKVKCSKRQEVVIGGYTDPEGSRVGLGALLAGVYEKGRLVYAGKIGTDFADKTLRELTSRLRALERETCPFAPQPAGGRRPPRVQPALVAAGGVSERT